jgi:uncharacterized delta-60 repeat protein
MVLVMVPGASAAPGQIDPTFGANGISRLDLGPTFKDIRVDTVTVGPDGSVLAVRSNDAYPREPEIRRYQSNGQLDPGSPPHPAGADFEVALADGDTLAATKLCCPSELRLQRWNPDGSPDAGFGEGGERTIPMPFTPRKVVAPANGKILLAGIGAFLSSAKAPPINQVGVARLNADGSLDPSFSEDGIVWLRGDHEVVGTDAGALAGRPGDGILVAVNATASTFGFEDTARGAADSEATLVGLTAGGGLDHGFGDKGAVKLSGSIAAAQVLADGAILAAGTKRGEKLGCCYAQGDFWVGRFTPAGAPDPAFGGGDGAASANLSAFDVTETALWAEDGSTLVGGSTVAAISLCVRLFMCEEAPALVRFNANGELDPAFGEGGRLRLQALATPVRGSAKGVLALAPKPGGGTIAAGSSGPDVFLASISPSGALDPGFGAGGIVAEREPLPSRGSVEAVAVDGQGRILVAGATEAGATKSPGDGVLVRTLPDGRLDPGFGGGRGYLEIPFEASDIAVEQERAVVLDRNGRWLTRVTPSGEIDSSFGEGGIVLPAGVLGLPRLGLRSVAALPGGGLLAAGSLVLAGVPRMAVVRLHADGSVDRSFGRKGIAVRGFGRGRPCSASKVLVQPDGRILLAGYVGRRGKEASESSAFALMRLLPDGALDAGFGRGGRLASRIRGRSEATDVALRDGRILAAGWQYRPGRITTLLRRYRSNGRLDRGFGRGGPPQPSTAAKTALWARATSLLSTPNRIVVFRGTSARPVLAFRRDGRLDRSYARGANLVPGRLAENWATPAPLLASQAGAPILAWTAWEPVGGGGARRQTMVLRRLLVR